MFVLVLVMLSVHIHRCLALCSQPWRSNVGRVQKLGIPSLTEEEKAFLSRPHVCGYSSRLRHYEAEHVRLNVSMSGTWPQLVAISHLGRTGTTLPYHAHDVLSQKHFMPDSMSDRDECEVPKCPTSRRAPFGTMWCLVRNSTRPR